MRSGESRPYVALALTLLAACFVGGCYFDLSLFGDPDTPDTVIVPEDVINAIDGERMKAIVHEITSELYAGRKTGSSGEAKARKYIVQHFISAGLLPGKRNGYEETYTVGGENTANVVGYLPGIDSSPVRDEIVVVGGHHDHVGSGHPGANDNASGTSMVIELAYAVGLLRGALKRTAVFVTFSGEEEGCLGANFFVGNDTEFPIKNTVLYINLDMVGLGKRDDSYLMTYRQTYETEVQLLLNPLLSDCTWDEDVFANLGVRTLGKWNSADDSCFHSACDKADRLDYDGMAGRAKDVLQVIWNYLQE